MILVFFILFKIPTPPVKLRINGTVDCYTTTKEGT